MEIPTQTKIYDPKGFTEKPVPPVGTKIEAKVTQVTTGRLGELIPAEILAKWKNGDPESPAIEVVALCSDGSIRRRTIQLPEANEVHPQSNLGKWKAAYGKYPQVGQKIFLCTDEKGFYQFQV